MGIVFVWSVGPTLQSINSVASNQRKVKAGWLSSPRVYSAEYFGHKIHYPQDEKLGIHETIPVCAMDGYSNMITEFAAMARKNRLTIHDQIYL